MIRFALCALLSVICSACNVSDVKEAVNVVDGVPRKTIDTDSLGVNAFANDVPIPRSSRYLTTTLLAHPGAGASQPDCRRVAIYKLGKATSAICSARTLSTFSSRPLTVGSLRSTVYSPVLSGDGTSGQTTWLIPPSSSSTWSGDRR
jgi:hypothetical protein